MFVDYRKKKNPVKDEVLFPKRLKKNVSISVRFDVMMMMEFEIFIFKLFFLQCNAMIIMRSFTFFCVFHVVQENEGEMAKLQSQLDEVANTNVAKIDR
jgi:hypothetical protein